MKMLIFLRHGNAYPEFSINIPNFLYSTIKATVKKYQQKKGPMKHHGLIFLIVKHHFLSQADGEALWQTFLDNKPQDREPERV